MGSLPCLHEAIITTRSGPVPQGFGNNRAGGLALFPGAAEKYIKTRLFAQLPP
jgi:hypothetical protein